MSVMHRALSRTKGDHAQQSSDYNPLAATTSQTSSSSRLWLVSFGLLSAALLVVFWPERLRPDDRLAAPESEPVAEFIDEVSRAEPILQPATDSESRPTPDTVLATDESPVSEETLELLLPEPSTTQPQASAPEPEPSEPDLEQTAERTNPDDTAPSRMTDAPAASAETDTTAVTMVSEPAQTESGSVSTVTGAADVQPRSSDEGSTIQKVREAEVQWQNEIEGHLAAGRIEQAEALLKRWISARPKAETPRIWLAKIYINNQVYTAAEPLIRTIEANEAQALMGIVYERTGRHNEAARVFETLFQRQPEQSQWLLFWAVNTENSGELAKSRRLYQTYLQRFSLENESLRRFAAGRLQVLGGP